MRMRPSDISRSSLRSFFTFSISKIMQSIQWWWVSIAVLLVILFQSYVPCMASIVCCRKFEPVDNQKPDWFYTGEKRCGWLHFPSGGSSHQGQQQQDFPKGIQRFGRHFRGPKRKIIQWYGFKYLPEKYHRSWLEIKHSTYSLQEVLATGIEDNPTAENVSTMWILFVNQYSWTWALGVFALRKRMESTVVTCAFCFLFSDSAWRWYLVV